MRKSSMERYVYKIGSREGKTQLVRSTLLSPWARIGKVREDLTEEKLSVKLYSWLEEQTALTM